LEKKLPYIVHYKFSQVFNVTAKEAYLWCTDFTPDDPLLMAEANATREIKKLTNATIFLKETLRDEKRVVVKEKLVQLYPDRLMWVSTHLSGPNKYSQFIYEVAAETSSSSRLNFTAQHIEHKTAMSKTEITALKYDLCKYDADVWKRLAMAMEKDLNL
jgi:hypothetical protein